MVTITAGEVRKVISPHNLSLLPICSRHNVRVCNPTELSVAKRFDVMAKYIYAKHRRIGGGLQWATGIYREHLRCFGNFTEGDGSGKKCFDDYVAGFDDLLDSIENNGYLENKGYIPVDKNGTIIDGSHRLAACLLYKRPLYAVEFDVDAKVYDYKQLLLCGLNQEKADAMAMEYLKLIDNVYVAVLFPIVRSKYQEVFSILGEYGDIVYEKSIVFTRLGRRNLISLLYEGEKWLGKDGEITKGLLYHSEKRFCDDIPVTFIFIKCDNQLLLSEAKSRVRSLFNYDKDPIHINDTGDSTVIIAEIVLNRNSIDRINRARIDCIDSLFKKKVQAYRQQLMDGCKNKDLYCIDGGGVLAIYGIRRARDLDYLHFGEKLNTNDDCDISSHNEQLCYYDKNLDDLIFNPINHFYYEGLKCVSIDNVRKAKERRKCKKDLDDVKLINSIGKYEDISRIFNRYLLQRRWRLVKSNVFNYLVFKIKMKIPENLYPIARRIYRAPMHLKTYCGPYNRTMDYKGYMINYTRDSSQIKKIWHGETYEPELTYKIIERLRERDKSVFIDIGANIGLMTLNVLAALPRAKVFAFESTKKQFDILRKTVNDNCISVTICHCKMDGSEGSLDEWWCKNGRMNVDVLKIDAAGSELRILQRAEEMLRVCGTKIYLKMNRDDSSMYLRDIIKYLKMLGRDVSTIAETAVEEYSADSIISYADIFVA